MAGFEILAQQFIEGALNAEEAEELLRLLESDPTKRQVLARHVELHGILKHWQLESMLCEVGTVEICGGGECRECASPIPVAARRLRISNGRRFMNYLIWTASLSLLVLFSLVCLAYLNLPIAPKNGNIQIAENGSGTDDSHLPHVAQIIRLSGVQWESFADRLRVWELAEVGRSVKFVCGSMEIMFARGVHVILEGPAEMKIAGPLAVDITQGQIVVRVSKEGTGFTVNTPRGQVVDLGTEFGVTIDPREDVRVVVFDGSVDVFPAPPTPLEKINIRQGEALAIGTDGIVSPVKMVESGQFLTAAQPRRPTPNKVIVAVRDNIRRQNVSKYYEIVHGGFGEDVLAYVDRFYEWNGVDETGLPKCLVGGDYIRTFNNDRYVSDYQMTVELAVPATLYVLFDRRCSIPDWLQANFTKTDMVVGLDECLSEFYVSRNRLLKGKYREITSENFEKDLLSEYHKLREVGPGNSVEKVFNVWQRTITQPGSVVLGAQDSVNKGQYGIVAVPLSRP